MIPAQGRSGCLSKDNINNESKGDSLIHRICGKDYLYKVIESDKTKRKWLDRNIAASRVAENKNDKSALGSLYQWGRESDGHDCEGSQTTDTKSSSDRPGHDKFIVLFANNPDYKWQVNPNKDLWKMPEKLNNPCPDRFHVPSKKEWEAEL